MRSLIGVHIFWWLYMYWLWGSVNEYFKSVHQLMNICWTIIYSCQFIRHCATGNCWNIWSMYMISKWFSCSHNSTNHISDVYFWSRVPQKFKTEQFLLNASLHSTKSVVWWHFVIHSNLLSSSFMEIYDLRHLLGCSPWIPA